MSPDTFEVCDRRLQGYEFGANHFRFGSASDSHAVEITARKPTSNLSTKTADVHGRQWTAIKGHS